MLRNCLGIGVHDNNNDDDDDDDVDVIVEKSIRIQIEKSQSTLSLIKIESIYYVDLSQVDGTKWTSQEVLNLSFDRLSFHSILAPFVRFYAKSKVRFN